MSDEYEPTEAERMHSHLLGYLDESGGLMNDFFNALHAADEAGLYVMNEGVEGRATDADRYLSDAFEEVDSENPDADEVEDKVVSALSCFHDVKQAMTEEQRAFELPDHVSAVAYGTLGEMTDYIYGDIEVMVSYAERYSMHAEE